MMVGDKRKTFVAKDDLLNGIGSIAKENGRSLYETVNEIFSLVIKAENLGIDLKGSIEECGKLKSARERGYTLCLENLWFEMAEMVYNNAREAAMNSWHVAGIWFGKHYTTAGIEDPFLSFSKDIVNFTWNIPELRLEKIGGRVLVSARNPRFSEAYAQLLASFMEGAISVMGYDIKEREASIGNVRLRAIRK